MNGLEHLFKNNRAWSESFQSNPDFIKLSAGQAPEYFFIGCSDSRVPPELILGLQPGDLFVHRNIGNLVLHTDINCQSVIQYAVNVLKVSHIIIGGHYGCGGVKAALQERTSGVVGHWISPLRDLYRHHQEELDAAGSEKQQWDRLCELNVRAQVLNLCFTSFVQSAWHTGQSLSVHGWIYNLETGRMNDLGLTLSSPEDLSLLEKG
ncbi:MAG: carbonic anhydrase [candidate division KSB1 bacterium]|nr:carbonic anhydrase [candidate division KSB1 bacterium]